MTSLELQTVGNYTWFLDYTLSQSVPLNQSTIAYTLRAHRNVSASYGAFWGSPARTFDVTIDGSSDSESRSSIDFRSDADIEFVTGSVTIDHEPDGTHDPVAVYASSSGSNVSAGFPVPSTYGYAAGHTDLVIALPTIQRNVCKVGDGGSYKTALVYVGDGGTFKPAQVKVGDGGTWKGVQG